MSKDFFEVGIADSFQPLALRPNVFTLRPPPGTAIIGPRSVDGGTGMEVIFPNGSEYDHFKHKMGTGISFKSRNRHGLPDSHCLS
jgi:hypothetical protein